MANKEIICRLCLSSDHRNLNDIDENIKSRLNVLLLGIDLNISKNPMLCTNCAIVLQKCCDFKSTCLATKEYIVAFVNEDDVKLDMEDIYLSFKGNEDVECSTGDYNVCCFCMARLKNCRFVSLEQDAISKKIKLEKCLPELDLSIIMKPTICVPCHGYLEDYFMFMNNCMVVEETIKRYCESLDTHTRNQIELTEVLKFSQDNALNESANTVDVIKKVDQRQDCTEKRQKLQLENAFISEGVNTVKITIKEEKLREDTITKTEVDNKHENVLKIDKFDGALIFNKPMMYSEEVHSINIEKEEGETKVEPTTADFMEIEDKKYLASVKDDIEMKTDQHVFDSSQDGVILPQLSKSYDTSINKNRSNVKEHQCMSCPYQTNKKSNLTCHSLVHKDLSEVPVHKCGFCLYQSKQKYYLKRHFRRVHKNNLDIITYKCESCKFQTKSSSNPRKHMLTHKDPPKITIYKCKSCSFQTKLKKAFVIHNASHRNPLVIWYHCESCSFKTMYKSNLDLHVLIHKNLDINASEPTVYQCDSCQFRTKHKKSLIGHNNTHKTS